MMKLLDRCVRLSLVLIAFMSILTGCRVSRYRGTVEKEPSDAMVSSLLTTGDVLSVDSSEFWEDNGYSRHMDKWRWSYPIAVIGIDFIRVVRPAFSDVKILTSVTQELVKYSSEDHAALVWNMKKGTDIEESSGDYIIDRVELLPGDGAPMLAANQVSYECEMYYRNRDWNACVARLQYGRYYTELTGAISEDDLSVSEFYGLVSIIDKRMQYLLDKEP